MLVSTTKMVLDCSVAPFVVMFQTRKANMSYTLALVLHVLRVLSSYQLPFVRRIFYLYGQLQRLIYKPFHVVATPRVKGLWYGQPVMDNHMQSHATIMYIHGGGFAAGSAETQSNDLIKPFVAALNRQHVAARVFSLEYDLAPERQFPHQHNQTLEAYEWLLSQNYANIVVMGDSAGGNLALTLMQTIVRKGLPQPAGGILLSPWVDLTASHASYDRNGETDYLAKPAVWTARAAYVADEDIEKASPGLQPMDGLAPLMVVYGGGELLADEIGALVESAKNAKVDVEEICHPELCHVYPVVLKNSEHATEAFDGMAKFVLGATTRGTVGELSVGMPPQAFVQAS
ncbi:Alpha/beta hydrolase fold-3 domain-containing protein [Achlya hypogyna]|uniref:Alpha/beta hydrolase fold-3 domain-containing protein n=1 Tax=Achlya hypogyna TaxID=1202772 RepID=A0A1V9ZKS5_ACHHY|nr:Alpha/beta hydrolase fold-3 domain-containing protein [Achlya hypogyna]